MSDDDRYKEHVEHATREIITHIRVLSDSLHGWESVHASNVCAETCMEEIRQELKDRDLLHYLHVEEAIQGAI